MDRLQVTRCGVDAERLAYLAQLDAPYRRLDDPRLPPEPSEVAAMAREILRLTRALEYVHAELEADAHPMDLAAELREILDGLEVQDGR
jgi:hypothetical protein